MPSTGTSDRGFTLLEVLVALALFAILAAALYGTWFGLHRARTSAGATMEARRETANALDTFRREFSSLIYKGDDKRLMFIVEDRDFYGKPASNLRFTTLTPPREGKIASSDQSEVRYKTFEKEGAIVVARGEKDIFLTGDPKGYPIMGNLESFLVECFDNGKWVKNWDTELNKKLPEAIRVTLVVREGGTKREYTAIAKPRMRQ